MSDAEQGPHEVWCDTQNMISHRCNCMASTYIDKMEDMQKRIDELEAALTRTIDAWEGQKPNRPRAFISFMMSLKKAREAIKGEG